MHICGKHQCIYPTDDRMYDIYCSSFFISRNLSHYEQHITSLLFSRISWVGSRPRNCWLFVTVESFYLKPVGQNLLDTTGLLLVPWRKWMKQWTVQSFNFRLGWLGRAKAKVALGW